MSPQNTPLAFPPSSPPEPDLHTIALRLEQALGFTGLRFYREVGRILIEELYDGDLEVWRSRGEKDTSYRKLETITLHGGKHISRSVLHRAAQIYELLRRTGDTWEHLGVSHFRAVMPLSEDRQIALLRKAEAEAWTVRRLEAAVRLLRERAADIRPPAFAEQIDALRKITNRREAIFGDIDQLEQLSAEEIQELSQKLLQVQRVCADLQQYLHRAL